MSLTATIGKIKNFNAEKNTNHNIFKNVFAPVKKNNLLNTYKKIVYRQDGINVDKEIEYNIETNAIEKITKFSYFNDKKISSIEEYQNGVKIRETSYHFFKVVTDFDKQNGKKFRTTNYDMKEKSKIISVYDYDPENEKIVRMSVYQPDGKNIAFVKEISPQSGIVTRCINYKKNSSAITSVSKYSITGETCIKTTYYYRTPIYMLSNDTIDKQIIQDNLNSKILNNSDTNKIAKLIDKLYRNKNKSLLKIS